MLGYARPQIAADRGASAAPARPTIPSRSSLLRPLEIFQIRRCLIFPGRHQVAVGAEEIILSADLDVNITLGAYRFGPDRLLHPDAAIFLGRKPGTGQRAVDRRDLVDDRVGIGAVGVNPLLDHRLVIMVQRQAGSVEGAWPPQIAGLDLEHVVAAAASAVDP